MFIRKESIIAAYHRAVLIYDDDIDKEYEIKKKSILADESLTRDEKFGAIMILNENHDHNKILLKLGRKRLCENCKQECLATSYCEYCIRNHLKENFSNWTSGNDDVDDLIRKCQLETSTPSRIAEWIPYENLYNIRYLTKGDHSKIYTAKWIGGRYEGWDGQERTLSRLGTQNVILKKLVNIEKANKSWFDEAESHLSISNKYQSIVKCFGLTQDPSSKEYFLVMNKMDTDLRKYLQRNHHQITWKERIQIVHNIIDALYRIHKEKAIHRDLHSGNILLFNKFWFIGDLGFCGPANKPSGSIYGNLSYIAPEVIVGKGYTFASDIYSIGMLIWEISSGQSPFSNYENDYDLAMDVVSGMRPQIVSGTPLEYRQLMEQCWNANPLQRPNIGMLLNKVYEIRNSYQDLPNDPNQNENIINRFFNLFRSFQAKTNDFEINKIISRYINYKSKVYEFENFPDPEKIIQVDEKNNRIKSE